MEGIKPNSHAYKAAQAKGPEATDDKKKVEKVISGVAKTKKKSGFRKFVDGFITEDSESIKSYVVKDVIIPGVKKAISDVVDTILFGGGGSRRGGGTGSKVSYSSYYDRGRTYRAESGTTTRHGYSYDDIVIDDYAEANEVLNQLCEMIDTYEIATVADLYDLVGITRGYTDNKYGWTNLRNAKVVRVRDGWMLDLPKALPIN